MTDTPNNKIPFVPENTTDPAAGLNLSLVTIDALLQLRVLGLLVNDPPASPTDADRYIVGTTPTGDWVGHENELAVYVADGTFWRFHTAYIALNNSDGKLYHFSGGTWQAIMGEGGVTTIGGLSDVDETGVADGYLLIYNETFGTWEVGPAPETGLPDAPSDGKIYGRLNGAWVEVTQDNIGGGGGGTWDGLFYITDIYGIVAAGDSADPSQNVWENKTSNYSSAFYFQDTDDTKIYAMDDNDTIWVFLKSDGSLVKSFAAPNVTAGWPHGLATDGTGQVYVAYDDGFVRKYDTDAETQTWAFALPGGATAPASALARDPDTGNIAVVTTEDTLGEKFLHLLDSAGNEVDFANVKVEGEDANAVAVGSDGAVYVCITGNPSGMVRKYDANLDEVWELVTGIQTGQGRGVVADDGTSYFMDENSDHADFNSGAVSIVEPDGSAVDRTIACISGADVALSPDGVWLIVQQYNGTTFTYDLVAFLTSDLSEAWRFETDDGGSGRTVTGINF